MKELFDLAGKKAIVTGGTRGLGNAMAEGLMEAGASVCIWGTSGKALTVAESFQKRGLDAHGVVVDISDRKDLERAFHESVAILGGLDILVNAAGTQRRHESPNFPVEDWDWVLEVNLTAPFELTGAIVTAENHSIHGGLGDAVAECLGRECPVPMERVGNLGEFGDVGKLDYLSKRYHLTAEDIVQKAQAVITRKNGDKI